MAFNVLGALSGASLRKTVFIPDLTGFGGEAGSTHWLISYSFQQNFLVAFNVLGALSGGSLRKTVLPRISLDSAGKLDRLTG